MTATWHIGDSLTVLRTLPVASVDVVITSPPFLALRSYLPADHPDKNLEMGSEGTPGAFLDALLDVVVECRRVLAPHGSLCVELGDTYSGSGGAGGDYSEDGWREGQQRFNGAAAKARAHTQKDRTRNPGTGWPLDKSLTLIPESFRFALAYGRNPHTGRTIEPWRVRNVVRWCRPNPPVGALGDKVRPATSDIAIACMSRARYFDLDAVRHTNDRVDETPQMDRRESARMAVGLSSGSNIGKGLIQNPAGAPPLDHWWHNNDDQFDQDAWLIPTHPYPGAHYATWPPALCIKPILAMCPQRVCTTCGKPSERIVETSRPIPADDRQRIKHANGERPAPGRMDRPPEIGWEVDRTTVGWSDCGCPDYGSAEPGTLHKWRNGHVLDPFAGSGTTGVVATGHGRDFTGIDLDPRNHDLARERIGMWLQQAEPGMATVPTKGLL